MTQTHIYEMFLQRFPQIKISQRFFEMTNQFYVKINHTCTTCCCRVHVEFSIHYDIYCYICCTLHTNDILQECGLQLPPKSLREFLTSVQSRQDDGCIYYNTMCLKGSFPQCGNLQKMYRYLYLHSTHEIGRTLFSLGKYE